VTSPLMKTAGSYTTDKLIAKRSWPFY